MYIKEAHSTDEWQVPANENDGVCYLQPRTLDARRAVVADFTERFTYAVPMVIDTMENPTNTAYAAWPERLYIVGPDGKLTYKGAMGPGGFAPEEVAAWLAAAVPPPVGPPPVGPE